MEHLLTTETLISLLTLTVLEVILGIDNVIFVSIIMDRMDAAHHKRARLFWMVLGIASRSLLLLGLGWLLSQKGNILFTLPIIEKGFDLASLVMIGGGLFLLVKTVMEIHHKLEDEESVEGNIAKPVSASFAKGMTQIVLVDMVFSFDSVVTASGVAKHLEIMITAVVIAMFVMFLFSARIADFIRKHPTLKMLALSFLVMIGLVLIVEGWSPEQAHEMHLKNYIYFGMAFSFAVELLNMKLRKKKVPVELNGPRMPQNPAEQLP